MRSDHRPFILLIDDDIHSANLLKRMLLAQGAPDIEHHGSSQSGEAALVSLLADTRTAWPALVVVDLKSHSGANLEFAERNHTLLRQKGIPLAFMTPPADRAARQLLLDAGASTVFFRQRELEAYRREAAAIVSFWARSQCLDAVGM